MTWIKENYIIEAADWLDELTDEEVEAYGEKSVMENPILVGYLLSAGIEFENEELMEYIIFYYNTFVKAAELQGVTLSKLEEDVLDEFEEEYHAVLAEFSENLDDDLVKTLCNQPMMFDFFMNEIYGEDEDGETLDEQFQTDLFLVGTALIALINKAIVR